MRALTKKHEFAGFRFPRYIPEFRKSRYDKRTFRAIYVTAGNPITPKTATAMFYLDSDFQPFTRWKWCDDVANIKHTGWFCDEYCDSKIRGIVANLPHGKYLAGWSTGEGMASEVDYSYIYDDIKDAAYAADSMAEYAAEQEREYQEEQAELEREEELNRGADEEELEGY